MSQDYKPRGMGRAPAGGVSKQADLIAAARRRRLMMMGGGVAFLLVMLAVGVGVILFSGEAPPQLEPLPGMNITQPTEPPLETPADAIVIIPTETPIPAVQDVIEQAVQAVVRVRAYDGIQVSQGSGAIISNEGYVITNAHVLGISQDIEISSPTIQAVGADVVGVSPCDDLALLRIRGSGSYSALPVDAARIHRTGDEVIAIGYPRDFVIASDSPASTIARISRLRVTLNNISGLIEHQAAINQGNSGGPLLDRAGYLIGINTLTVEGTQGLFYAIGLERAEQVWIRLYSGVPATTLEPLAVGQTARGSLRGDGEHHCYRIDAQAGQTLQLDAIGIDLDPYLTLWTPDNRLLAFNDDVSPGRLDARIQFIAPETGIYQVAIKGTSDKRRGDYQLTLTLVR